MTRESLSRPPNPELEAMKEELRKIDSIFVEGDEYRKPMPEENIELLAERVLRNKERGTDQNV